MVASPDKKPDPPSKSDEGVVKEIDWKDYRDHLSTADQEGRRQWIYARKPAGRTEILPALVVSTRLNSHRISPAVADCRGSRDVPSTFEGF